MKPFTKAEYRETAKRVHGSDGRIEFDDNARVSLGDDEGAYVQAWIWVDDSDASYTRYARNKRG